MSFVRDLTFAAGAILFVGGVYATDRLAGVGLGMIASAALWSLIVACRGLKERNK